ncbi:aldo/keto reductase [Pseudanabaenaceae cyanobacterium LEGE 13415]|nr:aldo/keto reductase [Pseudanabaenaceae cyanobacterium LEGE 13415]
MIEAQNGIPASRLGFASQYTQDPTCIGAAFEAGINYFFDYQLPKEPIRHELRSLLAAHREATLYTVGSETRQVQTLRQQLEAIRQALQIDVIDIFFAEYLSPTDTADEIKATIEELHNWKAQGLIRYVGVTTHHRPTGLAVVEQQLCDVLMHRYNMAHRKAETDLFPAAQAAKIPVIAFTCTRWGTLLTQQPNDTRTPTAAECYRFALNHPAVCLALTSPRDRAQLTENLQVLDAPSFSAEKIEHWRVYGDFIYGEGQHTFETLYP